MIHKINKNIKLHLSNKSFRTTFLPFYPILRLLHIAHLHTVR